MARRSLAAAAALVAVLATAWALPPDHPGSLAQSEGEPFPEQEAGGVEGHLASDSPEDCECVPYYQCANGTIIKNGVGLIDIRIRDGPCESYLDVCCRPPDRIHKPPRGTGGIGGGNVGDEGCSGGGGIGGGEGCTHGTGGSHGGDFGTGGSHGGDFGTGGSHGGDFGTGGSQGGDHGTGGSHGGDFGTGGSHGGDFGTGGSHGGDQSTGGSHGGDFGTGGSHGGDFGTGGSHGGDFGTGGSHGGDHGAGDFGTGGSHGGDHGTGGSHGGDFGTGGSHGGDHGAGGSHGGDFGTGGSHGGGHGDFASCGMRNPQGVGFRIVGDTDGEAQFGEFPWMTAILHEESLGDGNDEKLNVYKCGGSLIHPQVVLTGAHCVHEYPTGLKVRVGEWDTQTRHELLPHQDRNVRTTVMHPDFHHDSLYNDFALLVLESPVEPAENVQPVCLPPHDVVLDHSRCLASGWGKDVFGKEGRYQVILKKVEVPPVPRPECIERLRKTRLGNYFQLHESFMCAGGETGADTCKGDGGGPLVCPIAGDPSHYHQMGIVAWGIGCGEQNPAVYADVAYARPWIDNQMEELGFGTASYVRH